MPQLSTAVPLHWLNRHGSPFEIQPQLFGPTPPKPHAAGLEHVLGQVMAVPQLSVAGPHCLPAHVVLMGAGVQGVFSS